MHQNGTVAVDFAGLNARLERAVADVAFLCEASLGSISELVDNGEDRRTHILVGVTSAQTCLVLSSRLKALVEAGFRVSLVSGPGGMASHGNGIAGVSAYEISMARAISPVADVVALGRLMSLLFRLKPDMVEFSTPKAGLLGCMAAWICRVPIRIYFLRGLRVETVSGFKRRLLLWSERIAAACAHVVVANSRSLRERAIALGAVTEGKAVLLGEGSSNGVDVVRFSPGLSDVREQYSILADKRVIGFVGRLTADKGLPELLEAFVEILRAEPECYLLLVGWFDAAEDAVGRELRARVEGHPRIVCTGYVDDAAPYYRAMDVMALPSWREGFPNAVLEAAASGVPVVVTNCTGSCDAVMPEVTGLLVQPGDPRAISAAVLKLLKDRQLCGEMGKAARTWAVERFDQRRVLGMVVQYYRELLDAQNEAPLPGGREEAVTDFSPSL